MCEGDEVGVQSTNLGVGRSNCSGRASDFKGLCAHRRSNSKIKTVFRTVNFFARPLGTGSSASRPKPRNHLRQTTAMIFPRVSAFQVTIPDVVRYRRRKRRASDRLHSVPRPAGGGALLTLLPARRVAAPSAQAEHLRRFPPASKCGLLAAFISVERKATALRIFGGRPATQRPLFEVSPLPSQWSEVAVHNFTDSEGRGPPTSRINYFADLRLARRVMT